MISLTFPDRALMAEQMAKMLLEIEAVHFRADEPYKLTSGIASPVYIDCRKLISYPRIRSTAMDFACSL
ncbi:MAG: orotate phosphoribosyltransferase, partial [Pseudomonadota bacterium]